MSRKLDVLIAEKILGKTMHPTVKKIYDDGPAMVIAGPDPVKFPNSELYCKWGNVPRYSESWRGKWLLLKHLVYHFLFSWKIHSKTESEPK